MKKSRLTVGLLTAMLSLGVFAGCDNTVKSSKDGVILTYVVDGEKKSVKADDIFEEYFNDSSKYQSIFDSIYSIVVRNYFNEPDEVTYQGAPLTLGSTQVAKIETDAERKVQADERTAKTNADNNNSNWRDEFESICSSKGAEDREELKEKYIDELKKETFDENFYKYHLDEIKTGSDEVEEVKWNGYFKDMAPFHVSHILIKLSDGSGTNYADGTISEDNAKKLYEVVEAIKSGEDNFGTIAYQFSEDTGSAKAYGDLGIMDYSTGYVNEFKLGVYAYETLLAKRGVDSRIAIPDVAKYSETIKGSFKDVDIASGDVPTIDYSVFKELKEVKDVVRDEKDKAVIEDSANFYPRNIIYNKYLNRHSVAFIEATGDDAVEAADTATCGFHKFDYLDNKFILGVKVAGEWNPILVTRAGSDYQGIHFIVVNRSPFVETQNGVSLNDYYTTFYPEQTGYPRDESGKQLQTYINFSSSVTSDTKSRADGLKSTLKSFDSEKLNKYIFLKYFKKQGLSLNKEGLYEKLINWLERSVEKTEHESKESWEKTWNGYIDTLRQQNTARTKLVSEACKISYLKGNSKDAISDADYAKMKEFLIAEGHEEEVEELIGSESSHKTYAELYKEEGGLCNDGKSHF